MTYINTEQMQSAAYTFNSAVDQLQRVLGNFDQNVHTLQTLLGQGYGSNIDRLIEALENHTAALTRPQICVK